MAGTEDFDLRKRFSLDFSGPATDQTRPERIDSIAVEPNFGGPNAGDHDDNGTSFDPVRHSGRRNRDGSWSLKRGRSGPRTGSGERRKSTKEKELSEANLAALERTLKIFYAGLAGLSNAPEWRLDDEDTHTLGVATGAFLVEFDMKPDDKLTATVGLVTALAAVNGPKIWLIRERMQKQKNRQPTKPEQAPIHVVR
jgi:hypothetical protein